MGRRPKRSESELNKNDPTNKPNKLALNTIPSMDSMKEVALSDLINQQKVGRYQKFILITCLLLMIMDQYVINLRLT
jgi:hypothetical protein